MLAHHLQSDITSGELMVAIVVINAHFKVLGFVPTVSMSSFKLLLSITENSSASRLGPTHHFSAHTVLLPLSSGIVIVVALTLMV